MINIFPGIPRATDSLTIFEFKKNTDDCSFGYRKNYMNTCLNK